jgi:HEAT repeat protein
VRKLSLTSALVVAAALITTTILGVGCNRERETLAQDLKNERPEIRAGAVHRLGEMKDIQDLPLFLSKAQDGSATVRRAAAEALGMLGNPRGIDVLGSLLSDPDEDVQAAAAQSLAQISGDKARAYLMNAFARRGTTTRNAIAKAFEYGPGLQEAVRKETDANWDRTLKALDSGGAAERVGAAEELGRSGRPEAVDKLIPLLGNDAILLAAGAARGLGAAGDKKAVASLEAVLKENYPALKEASAQALGELGDPTAAPVLAQVAVSPDTYAPEAAEALARLPQGKDVDAALCQVATTSANTAAVTVAAKAVAPRGDCPVAPVLARLAKGGPEIRAALAALAHLGQIKGKEQDEVAAKVIPLLENKDPMLQLAAVHALGGMGATAAGPALSKLVSAEAERLAHAREKWVKDPMPLVYTKGFGPALPGLHGSIPQQNLPPAAQKTNGGGTGSADDDPATKLQNLAQKIHENNLAKAQAAGQTLHTEKEPPPPEIVPDVQAGDGELLAAAAAALGRVNAADAATLLTPLAQDPDDEVRTGALQGLASLGGADNLKKVEAGWAGLPPESVAALSETLRQAGPTPEVVHALIAGLSNRDSDRASIALALGQLKVSDAEAPLQKLLTSSGEEASAAARALGQLGQASAVKPLSDLLKDSRSAGQEEAIVALGSMKNPEGRDALVRQLLSDRPESRAAAVRALAALGPQGAAAASGTLEALRADYYRDVREAVERALSSAPPTR